MELKEDVLRGRFTAWMKVVVKRAKIDYIRRQKKKSLEVSIENQDIADKLVYELVDLLKENECFLFDNESISYIFQKLSPKRKKVLELLFLHNFTPEEVADEMHCTLQNVYNMRSLAIREIRIKLGLEM